MDDIVNRTDLIEPFKKDIKDVRNKFAHIEESAKNDENGNSYKSIADIPFTEERCIEIRKKIKDYKKIFKKIEENI
jgi:hypothetical protein